MSGARPIIESVTDAITFHPSNRTGTPEERRPACKMIASTALRTVRARLADILDTEEPSDDHAGIQRVIELLDEA